MSTPLPNPQGVFPNQWAQADTDKNADHDAAGKFAPGNRMGERRRRLTPKRHRHLVELIGQGRFLAEVARAAGTRPATLRKWLWRGQRDTEAGEATIYARLYVDARSAAIEADARLVETIGRAAAGELVEIHAWTRVRRDADGKIIETLERRRERTLPADWRAARALCEMRDRSRFGVVRDLDRPCF